MSKILYKHRVSIPTELASLTTIELLTHIIKKQFGDSNTPIIISFGGTGGVGKSTLTSKLAENLVDANVLALDDYKTSRQERSKRKILGSHPKANRFDLLHNHLEAIKHSKPFQSPVYNSITGNIDSYKQYTPAKYNLLDGEISTYKELYDYADLVVFIEAAFSTQFKTRLRRDIVERGSSHVKVLRTFWQSNLLDYHRFGIQAKDRADILLYCEPNHTLIPVSINHTLTTK
ncbi:MAG: hypothetical protein PF692_03495 [Kiritimatiellae bacterium]|jgi:uridine kinase|nr:hypothetical protein [Kiritimatiellia bacterium]